MAGLETVYATHNFVAENNDEISFNVGEPVIVLEKDEGYHDGWWQGRNIRGEIGLFPMNYTNIKPPNSQTLENKIDTLESTIKNMNINNSSAITSTSDLPPTPSISSSSRQSSTLPQQQPLSPITSPITSSSSIKGGLTSSASSISSSYSHSIHTTTSASNMAPASYQKKLSTKYVHQSVYTSLQNAQLNTTLPEDWSVEQVGIWLGLMGFSDMTDNFEKQEITGDILLELNVDSLKELNVSTFGKRFKIVNAIKVLAEENMKRKESSSPLDNQNNHLNQPTLSPTMSLTPSMTPPSSNTNTMASSNHTNPYIDDDLISDYSSIIKKSLQSSPTSPRLSTISLTTKIKPTTTTSTPSSSSSSSSNPISLNYNPLNPSDPSFQNNNNNNNNNNNMNIHFQQQHTQPLINNHHPSPDFIQRSATPLNRSLSTSSYLHNNMNHHKSPLTHSQSLNKSNTMYNISSPIDQPQHRISVDQIGRSSISSLQSNSSKSRYNFVRNSFLNGNKNQNVLTSSSRFSMDGIAQRLNKENSLPDMEGWLYKQGDKYKTWNKRWFVLKEANFFYFKSPKDTRMKGIINLHGYQILADENINPGKYCFKLQHEKERTFYFYTDTEPSLKAWMNKLLKSTITRDYSAPVMSSNNIPTVSLDVARRMKPRPPSTIFGKDFDPERPLSPSSQYDSRPFSLTYSEQPQPIMRMSMSDDTHHLYPNNNNQTQESGFIDEDELVLQQRQQRRPSSSFNHHHQQQSTFSSPPPISSPPASPPPSSPPPPPPSQLMTSSSSISSSILSQTLPQPVPSTSSSSTITDHNKKMKIASMIYFNDEDEDLIDPLQRPSTQLSFHTTSTMNDHRDVSSNKIDLSTFQSHDSSSLLQQQQQQPLSQQRKDSFHIIHDRIDELENEDDDEEVKEKEEEENNKMDYLNESWQWDEKDYLQWVNQHLLNYNNTIHNNNNMIIQLNHITELRTGHYLIYLLESISGKQIKRTPSTEHHQPKDPLTNMQMLDFIVTSFKFMGREGVLVDGRYTIKDIFAGNEPKIIEMLRTIKDWANQLHPSSVKKASGCTFGDNEEVLLDTLGDN